jgi:ATP-dependent helicase/DNAse subunit B
MTKRFQQTLFIARSKESADLYLRSHTGAIKTITLSSLLSSLYDSDHTILDQFLGKLLLQQVIGKLDLKHFDYLINTRESLAELHQHIVSCKRNRVGYDSFTYPYQKLNELETITAAYEAEKQRLGMLDSADVLLETIQNLSSNAYFEQFQNIVIDVFEENGINFCTSKAEEEALAIIKNLSQSTQYAYDEKALNAPATFTPQNSYFDEALFAIKAVRTLMQEGVSDKEIAIVTGNLSQYRRVMESYAAKYGVSLQFSSGVPMMQSPLYQQYLAYKDFDSFKEAYATKVRSAYEAGEIDDIELDKQQRHFSQIKNLEQEVQSYAKKARELFEIDLDKSSVLKDLADEKHIPPSREQNGVIVTEPNQMTLQQYEHVIFIGTDLAQFPPKSKGNFLATAKQREELLYFNNTYELSEYYYAQICKNSENVHLGTANYSGKKKLFLSPIIDNAPKSSFEMADIAAEREQLLASQRYNLDDNGERYIASMIVPSSSNYDGKINTRTFETGTLSASSMNTYAQCPLRYLLTHQYRCDPIALEKDEEALEATDIGTMFHSIAEIFANKVKAGEITVSDDITDAIKATTETIAKEVFDAYMQEHVIAEGRQVNVFHKIVYNDLVKGLYDEHHQKGLVIRFLEYVHGEGSLEHFLESERRFMLDEDFKITDDKEKALVKGFIDRIDQNTSTNHVAIIDYKTGKYAKKKEEKLIEGIEAYKQFQLPLYLLYAKRAFKECSIDAFLVSFKDGDGVKSYAHMSTDAANGVHFGETYEQRLIERIRSMKADIEAGEFSMTPSEQNCEYCDYERICHKSVLPWKEHV